MTPAQRTALANPCLLGMETAHPRYGGYLLPGVSLVLTVNAGYE